jgi:cytochrome P450
MAHKALSMVLIYANAEVLLMSIHSARSGDVAPALSMPPRTGGLPVVGALPAFFRRPFDFFLSARERYGDIYTLDLGIVRWVIVNHPRHAEYILRDNSQNYRKGGGLWDMVRTILGNGLVVSEGDFWLRQRRMIQPHFHRKQLAGLTDAMVDATTAGLESWDRAAASQQPVDLLPRFSSITMRVIARALFGQGLGQAALDRVSDVMAFTMDYLMTGTITYSLPRWLPLPGARRHRAGVREFDALVAQIIAHERSAEIPSDSLLGMLVQMVDEESGERMTDAQLVDEVKTFFLAGYETTSLALTWSVYLLTQHPAVLDKLRAEVDAVLAGRTPSFADLPALTYTRMVIQETMRLRPPAFWVPRTAVADDVIDGYAIPAGASVMPLIYGIHHHPDLWEQPERFDPERFTGEALAQQHKSAWMPFGLGQRQCIGRDFSIMEAQIILAMIVQRYTLTTMDGQTVLPKFSTTLKPDRPVMVGLRRRAGA